MTDTDRLADTASTTPSVEGGETAGPSAAFWANVVATPSPAAQDDPAKGLEVIVVCGIKLTDHATATREIAELEARVAELEELSDRSVASMRRFAERALAAEADAARVRGFLTDVLNTSGARPEEGYHALNYADAVERAETYLAALTQRGA